MFSTSPDLPAQFAGMSKDALSSSSRGPAFPGPLRGYAAALAATALATLAGQLLAQRWGNAPVVLLYIPAVLAAAVLGGLWPALAAALLATLAFNYYFTAPLHTFAIYSPGDIVTVAALFSVAVVTSQLAGRLREQAEIAAAHAARNATIAGFARKLLSCPGEKEICDATVAELALLFDCNAVLVLGAEAPRVAASAPAAAALAPSDLATAALAIASGQPAGRGVQRANLVDWHFRPIAAKDGVVAAAGLAREDGRPPFAPDRAGLLDNLLDQAALAFARARLEDEARENARLRERDKLQSLLLSSIGEDVKPRLKAIAAGARELRRGGAADKAVVADIAGQAVQLERYVDGLVDLDSGSGREPIEAGPVSIDLHRRTVRRDGAEVHLSPKEYALLAELAKQTGRVLSHRHLLSAVWGPAHSEQIDYLRVAVRSLRQKLEADPSRPALIVNEPAVGYRLVA